MSKKSSQLTPSRFIRGYRWLVTKCKFKIEDRPDIQNPRSTRHRNTKCIGWHHGHPSRSIILKYHGVVWFAQYLVDFNIFREVIKIICLMRGCAMRWRENKKTWGFLEIMLTSASIISCLPTYSEICASCIFFTRVKSTCHISGCHLVPVNLLT